MIFSGAQIYKLPVNLQIHKPALSDHALHRNSKMNIKWSQRFWCNFCYYYFSRGELMYFLLVWLGKPQEHPATSDISNAIFWIKW